MSSITKFAALFGVMFLAGCNLVDEGTDKVNTLTGNSIEKDTLKNGDISIKSASDTVWVKIPVKKGFSYEIHTSSATGDVSYSVNSGDKILVDSDYGYGSFLAPSSDSAAVAFCGTASSYPFTAAYSVEEIAPLDAGFAGKWILVSETYSAFGKTTTHTTSAASLYGFDADELMEFRNDSLYTTQYSVYGDSLSTTARLANTSYIFDMKYALDGNTLTFTSGNSVGTSTVVYQRFTGSINDIKWAAKGYKIPAQFHGTWYLSHEYEHEYESDMGDVDEYVDSASYKSAAESDEIYLVTADSVIRYSKNAFGDVDTSRSAADESMWMFQFAKAGGSTFGVDEVYVWAEADESEIEQYQISFTKYTGSVPPAEWMEVTVPANAEILNAGSTFSKSGLKKSDTIWLKLPVVGGESYSLNAAAKDCQVSASLVSADKKSLGELLVWSGTGSPKTFTASASGFYYVGMIVEYLYSSSTSGSVEITFGKSGALTASSVQGSWMTTLGDEDMYYEFENDSVFYYSNKTGSAAELADFGTFEISGQSIYFDFSLWGSMKFPIGKSGNNLLIDSRIYEPYYGSLPRAVRASRSGDQIKSLTVKQIGAPEVFNCRMGASKTRSHFGKLNFRNKK